MTAVCLIDTSIFLNILDVPSRNQDRDAVVRSFSEYVELGITFILPMASILETGNHIAQNGDGGTRRKVASRFCEAVKGALNGEAPWGISDFPDKNEILTWIGDFPDQAGRNKSSNKTTEGTSFGDLSIIKEYEKCCRKFSMCEVFVWSLDADLKQFHHK
jgi:hypothetical protein